MLKSLFNIERVFFFVLFFFFLGAPFEFLSIKVAPASVKLVLLIFLGIYIVISAKSFKEAFTSNPKDLLFALLPLLALIIFLASVPSASSYFVSIMLLICAVLFFIFKGESYKNLFGFLMLLLSVFSFSELSGIFLSASCKLSLLIAAFLYSGLFIYLISKRKIKTEIRSHHLLFGGFLVVSMIIFVYLFSFDPGIKKEGVILFDVIHDSFEKPTDDFSTNINDGKDFGQAKLVKFLNELGYKTRFTSNFQKDLKTASILYSSMNTKNYTKEEIAAVVEFVKSGGGLFIIGDHTDLENNMRAYNKLLKNFGLELNFDTIWTVGSRRGELKYYYNPLIYDIKDVSFSVGASVKASYPARVLYEALYDTHNDLGDYSKPAYLGNERQDSDEQVGNIVLGATRNYGAGRVILLSDSSYFQNASLYRNYELAYRTFDCLNKKNISVFSFVFKLTISIILMVVFSYFIFLLNASYERKRLFIALFSVLMVGAFIISNVINVQTHTKFSPQRLKNNVLVDFSHANKYQTYWETRNHTEGQIDALFKQIIRTDLHPFTTGSLALTAYSLPLFDTLIIVTPRAKFCADEIAAVKKFVENGGKLIVADGEKKGRVVDELLAVFSLKLADREIMFDFPEFRDGFVNKVPSGNIKASFIKNNYTQNVSNILFNMPVEVFGGEKDIATVKGRPAITLKQFGKGKIILIGDASFFANGFNETEDGIKDLEKMKLVWNILTK